MAIKVGDRIPRRDTLTELITDKQAGLRRSPNAFQTADLTKGKKIVIFGLRGA